MLVTKSGKQQRIKVKSIDDTLGSLQEANRVIRTGLSRNVIFQLDENVIAYYGLRLFDIRSNKYSIDDKLSLEEQCNFLLHKYGIYEGGRKVVFRESNEDDLPNPIHDFVKHIVGFYQLPGYILRDLESKVKGDLKGLLTLIETYELNPKIADYKKGSKRHEHESRVVIDFYERCIAERKTITDYLVNHLEDRALSKAVQDPDMRHILGFAMFEEYRDRPYRWWQPNSIQYFDFEKINTCRHRLNRIGIRYIHQMENLYLTNKELFYKKLKKIVPPDNVFQQLKTYYLRILPKLQEREPIFNELHFIMKAKRWYSFTALALTQVEGMFSDMLYILKPSKNFGSLSEKVLAVRPYSDFGESSLDYFEYHLPRIRNSFLHSGSIKGKNFKHLSYDLLYDLLFLVTVFDALKDAHIELNSLLRKDTSRIIFGLKDFNHIFSLVEEIDQRNKKSSNEELKKTLDAWNSYKTTMLIPFAEMEYWAQTVNEHIDKDIQNFFNQIKIQLSFNGKEIDLNTAGIEFTKTSVPLIAASFPDVSYDLRKDYTALLDINTFLNQYKIYLPDCPEDAVAIFTNIHTRHKINFAKLVLLKNIFQEL